MNSHWTLHTNAKSEKNALTLLNKARRHLNYAPQDIDVEGDRFSGHRVRFRLHLEACDRADFLYQLLVQAERLGNSWTLGAVTADARGWCNRSRIAGIQQIEWQEVSAEPGR